MSIARYFADFLIQPWLVMQLLIAAALIHLWRRRLETRGRLLMVTLPFVGLVVSSLPVVSYFLCGSLEWRYPIQYGPRPTADAIVVLGGGAWVPPESPEDAVLATDSMLRCVHAAKLYHSGPRCPVIVTGGIGSSHPQKSVAGLMAAFLTRHGVAPEDLIVEDKSRTTFENAQFSTELIASSNYRSLLVVSEATHLRRGEACFRKLGFETVASGCDYRTESYQWTYRVFLPDPGAARDVKRALHEWVGLVVYRLKGWI